MSNGAFRLFLLAFLSMGAATAVIGATLPVIVQNYQWSYRIVGILLAGNAGGYFISTLISGLVLDRMGLHRMLFCGLVLQGFGVLMFGWGDRWEAGFLVLLLVGFGQGMLEVSANCGVIQLDRLGSGRLMNLMHSGFTIGAVLSPLLAGFVLRETLPWRLPFWVCGAFSLAISIALLRTPFPSATSNLPRRKRRSLRIDRSLVAFGICILIYVGIEMGVSSWVGEYYVSFRSSALSTASYLVTLYWFGILSGRLLVSWRCQGHNHWRILNTFSAMSVVGFACLFVAPGTPMFPVAVFMTGFGLSVLYPEVMVIVGERYARDQGWAVGLVASCGGLGALVFPLVFGQMADRWSLRVGFGGFLVMAVVMGLIFFILGANGRKGPEVFHDQM